MRLHLQRAPVPWSTTIDRRVRASRSSGGHGIDLGRLTEGLRMWMISATMPTTPASTVVGDPEDASTVILEGPSGRGSEPRAPA